MPLAVLVFLPEGPVYTWVPPKDASIVYTHWLQYIVGRAVDVKRSVTLIAAPPLPHGPSTKGNSQQLTPEAAAQQENKNKEK